jgi:hypothetical protein
MLPCYRAFYARRLLGEIVKKTSLPYELLVWLNLEDPGLESCIQELTAAGYPIRVVGKTPHNIGMEAFKPMIEQAQGELVVQLEDDVLFISRKAGEIAGDIFSRHPEIGMLSADVWQDELSNGGHPPPESYTCVDGQNQLFEGPIDGGLSIYPRNSVSLLLESSFTVYFGMGRDMHFRLHQAGQKAYKCRRIRIFHVSGPIYHSMFPGMVDFEIAKYRRIGHKVMVDAFEDQVKRLPPKEVLDLRLKVIEGYHESFDGYCGGPTKAAPLLHDADGCAANYASHIRACLYNDRLATLSVPAPITGGKSVVLPVRDVAGCSRVDIVGSSEEPFTILVEEADVENREFSETKVLVSAREAALGLQKICSQIFPFGTLMRLTVTNTRSISPISLSVNGIPRRTEGVGLRGATGVQGAAESYEGAQK